MNFLSHLKEEPADALFGIQRAYEEDPRSHKVNLSIGTYKTEELHPLILKAVKEAEHYLVKEEKIKDYLPILGLESYIHTCKELIFGEALPEICGLQAVGGTGALHIGSKFLLHAGFKRLYISRPTWGNHERIFKNAGFEVVSYPYFDWVKPFETMEKGSVVLLQPCCHNPTGSDPSDEQWAEIAAIVKERELFPFFDSAYQGFGEGVEEDARVMRLFLKLEIPFMVAASQSKNFGLYRERTGGLFLRCLMKEDAQRFATILRAIIRGVYSNPPAHGAQVVAHILSTPSLKKVWLEELSSMRTRITNMRKALVEKLNSFDFLLKQKGMFSYTYLSPSEVECLRDEYGIYMLRDGRINVAGLNSKNVGYVAESIIKVHAQKEL